MDSDTIAAVATPAGRGGIAIVRVSGAGAESIMKKVFRPMWERMEKYEARKMYYGSAINPESGEDLDEVLACMMPGPHSFTREDVLEIHCHGGQLAVQVVLEAVLAAGARLAEPGEFTRRAFINGRLNLSQAQAVLDIINAQTREGLRRAVDGLTEGIGDQVKELRKQIINILAAIDVAMDFPEDGVPELEGEELETCLVKLRVKLNQLLDRAINGRVYRDGMHLVLTGKPNVGKSSLLNALLGEDRVIVSEHPGTTRDVVKEEMNIGGVPVVLADTAGIRKTGDKLEALGAEQSRKAAANADMLLIVWDAANGVKEEDRQFLEWAKEKPKIVVVNKADLVEDRVARAAVEAAEEAGYKAVVVSAVRGSGLDVLREDIKQAILGSAGREEGGSLIVWERSIGALRSAQEAVIRAIDAFERGYTPDIVAIDLQEALEKIGEITGETATEDVIDEIFSRFCVGK